MPQSIPWKTNGELTRQLPLWGGADPRTIDVFLPETRPGEQRRALVICLAGGGYRIRSAHEGPIVALWLAMHGFAAADVPYRTAEEIAEGETLHPRPILDACRAVRVLKQHASELGLKDVPMCLLGFSAGGHLAASACLLHQEAQYEAADDLAAGYSASVDALALVYPVIRLLEPLGHSLSGANLLGAGASEAECAAFSLDQRVGANVPPLFAVHAQDDEVVPLGGMLAFCGAARKSGAPVESHAFPRGGHGFGLALDRPGVGRWGGLFLDWLGGLGIAQ